MPSVITILFRGLLVFHQVAGFGGQPPMIEVGLLSQQGHFARIVTYRDGVRESTKCLFPDKGGFDENCMFQKPPTTKLVWELKIDDVDDPDKKGAYPLILGSPHTFDRKAKPPRSAKYDFRWILDLENGEFPYGNQTGKLATSKLIVVLKIPAGEFYAKLLSPELYRHSNIGASERFGYIAGGMAFDIKVKSGGANLWGAMQGDLIFPFKSEPGVTYEISNSPPDTETMLGNHFGFYYDLFAAQPREKFRFSESPNPSDKRGPNPALCGELYLGQSSDSLTSNMFLERKRTPRSTPRKRQRSKSNNRTHRQH